MSSTNIARAEGLRANWQILSVTGATIVAKNGVTGRDFSGTQAQFDAMLATALLQSVPVSTSESKGGSSATITTGTVAVTGSFVAVTVLADAVFTSLTRTNTTGLLGSTTVPAGVTIFGDITGYQLASGAVIAYGA